jgi:hypothetical protein
VLERVREVHTAAGPIPDDQGHRTELLYGICATLCYMGEQH